MDDEKAVNEKIKYNVYLEKCKRELEMLKEIQKNGGVENHKKDIEMISNETARLVGYSVGKIILKSKIKLNDKFYDKVFPLAIDGALKMLERIK